MKPRPIQIDVVYKRVLAALFAALLFVSCSKDDPNHRPTPPPLTGLDRNILIVELPVGGLPAGVAADRVTVDVKGFDWQVIATLEAPIVRGAAAIVLPAVFPPQQLQEPDRRNDMGGYWPVKVSDPEARVASLGDIVAWQGGAKVGRFYISDWDSQEDNGGKSFIYYHYTDRPYTLSGSKGSYVYSASFKTGWNAYANKNSMDPGSIHIIYCSTAIPENLALAWRFEVWR